MGYKMNDNDIIKALECCSSEKNSCTECPIDALGYCECMTPMSINCLNLINRLKAEIEELKEAYAVYEETTGLKWVRAEAIKEFAERVKDIVDEPALIRGRVIDIIIDTIDNLVKEMTGEDNGN